MSEAESQAVEIFCIFSKVDKEFWEKLKNHLTPLLEEQLISTWDTGMILPGEKIEVEVDKHFNMAGIIVLLVSADLNNKHQREIRRALEQHNNGAAHVIPVLLRSCVLPPSFSGLSHLPKDGEPIKNWKNEDDAFVDVVNGIRRVVEEVSRP